MTGFMNLRWDKQCRDFEGGKLVLVLNCSVKSRSMFNEPDFNIWEFNRWEPTMGLKGVGWEW